MLYDGHKDTEKLATSAKKRTTTLYEYASRPEFVRFFSSLFSIQESKRTENESGDHMKDATGTIHSEYQYLRERGCATASIFSTRREWRFNAICLSGAAVSQVSRLAAFPPLLRVFDVRHPYHRSSRISISIWLGDCWKKI